MVRRKHFRHLSNGDRVPLEFREYEEGDPDSDRLTDVVTSYECEGIVWEVRTKTVIVRVIPPEGSSYHATFCRVSGREVDAFATEGWYRIRSDAAR